MKPNQKKIVLFSVLLVVMACSESLPDLVQKNEKAIFKIFTFDHDGDASFTGSGFFIDDEGTGVTNHHVMEEAVSAFVKLPDGSIFEVEKIITERTDIELCKFQVITNGKKTPFLKLDKSLPLKGSAIFVIGSPKGLDNSVSTGIIAAVRKNEYLSESNFDFFSDYYQGDLIQFTAPFYHGNSGSPIMNMRGKVVGVGAAGVEDNESESINIAFPIQALDSLAAMEPRVLSSGKSNLHYVFADAKDHPVIINSIELEDSVTILHCKYFNIDLMENPALLYTEIDSTHQDFYIEDVKTKKKYFVQYSEGISNDSTTRDTLYVGQSQYFRLYFQGLPKDISTINVMEGNDQEAWNFYGIDLKNSGTSRVLNTHGFFKSLAIATAGDQLRNSGVKFALETYLKFVPKDHEAHSMLGLVDFWDFKYDEAIAHYNRAISFSDNYPPYYANRSMIHYQNNNLTKALKDITFAINLNDEVGYIKQRIMYLLENEQYDKAIADANYLLRFGGQSPNQTAIFYNYRGDAYLQLGQRTKACLDWKKSIALQRDENVLAKIKTNCQ